MITRNRLLLATALTFGASSAFAIEPLPPVDPAPVADDMKPAFDTLDTNKDGQLAKEEVPLEHELSTLFASFDDDSDGFLSRVEFDDYAQGGKDEEEP